MFTVGGEHGIGVGAGVCIDADDEGMRMRDGGHCHRWSFPDERTDMFDRVTVGSGPVWEVTTETVL
ncbi:hypothetical protein BJF89_16375 [Corynebacterium sp. CNJ-954]|nr:hypothetical protein BJF89_16375 [Corynebacterium sp. CNJ-954]